MLRLVLLADRVLRTAAGVALALSGSAMFAQVIARYVFDAPFAWAEEFATLLFSWIIFLGAAAVQRTDSHLSVDTLRARLGPPARPGSTSSGASSSSHAAWCCSGRASHGGSSAIPSTGCMR